MRLTAHEHRLAQDLQTLVALLRLEDRDPAEHLAVAADLESSAFDLTRAVVSGARDRGLSWADVGRAFGVSRQAAQQRFGE